MFFFNIQGTTKQWSDYAPQSLVNYQINIDVKHEILKEIFKLQTDINFDDDSMEKSHYEKLKNKNYSFNQKYKEIKINEHLIDTPIFLRKTITNIISFFSNLMKFYRKINPSDTFHLENFKKAITQNDEYFQKVHLNFETVYNYLTFFLKYSLMDDYTNHQRNILANICKIISSELMKFSGKNPNEINNTYSPLVQDFKNKKKIHEESMAVEINKIEKINLEKLTESTAKQMFSNIQLFSKEIKSDDKNSQSSKGPIIITAAPIAAAAAGTTILSPRSKSSNSLPTILEETENTNSTPLNSSTSSISTIPSEF